MTRNCPICNNNPENTGKLDGIAGAPWVLVFCKACQFVYVLNPPDYETLSSSYAWEETYEKTKKIRKRAYTGVEYFFKRILANMGTCFNRAVKRDKLRSFTAKYMADTGVVIELGSGTGYNVDKLPPNITLIGIEISPFLAKRSEERFHSRGGRVINSPALKGLESLETGIAAGAIAKSYLEHEIYPKAVLSELNRTLKNGSPLIVKLPNYASWLRNFRGRRWSGYRFPDHVNYFTPESLINLLVMTGFSIERFTFLDHFPASDNMWCAAKKIRSDQESPLYR